MTVAAKVARFDVAMPSLAPCWKPKAKTALASFMKAATASSPSLCLALYV